MAGDDNIKKKLRSRREGIRTLYHINQNDDSGDDDSDDDENYDSDDVDDDDDDEDDDKDGENDMMIIIIW